MPNLIFAENINKSFAGKPVLCDLSLQINKGEIVGLCGKSGCGKTTLAKILVGLTLPDSGTIYINGTERVTRPFGFQMVFQNYKKSQTPHMTVYELLLETFRYAERRKDEQEAPHLAILETAQLCNLSNKDLACRPSQLSGGQAQRAAIARALIAKPEFIVFDEPVSALDISLSVKILDLILSIRRELSLSCLFISHDINFCNYVCDRTLLMENGRIQGDDLLIPYPKKNYVIASI